MFYDDSIYYSPSNNTKIREIMKHVVEYMDSVRNEYSNKTIKLEEFQDSLELRKKVDEEENVGIAFKDDLKVKLI
jgi:hypothetical protein